VNQGHSKIILSMIAVIALSQLWLFFSDESQWSVDMWNFIGVDISEKYDIHPFYDYPKGILGEKLKWKVYDLSYLILIAILVWLIRDRVSIIDRHAKIILKSTLIFSIFRVIEYCLFRYNIPLSAMATSLIMFSLYFFKRK